MFGAATRWLRQLLRMIDELESVFASQNAQTGFGYMPTSNYGHEDSKALGDKFCGYPLDQVRATRPRRACRSGSTSWRAKDSSTATPRLPQHPRPPPPRRHPRPRRSAPAPSRPSSRRPRIVPDVEPTRRSHILTNENLVQLLMAQHSRLQRALRKIQELEGGVLVVPAAAPVEAAADDGEPPAKLDGGALATVRSVSVIVPDTPEGSAPIAHVELATSLPFVGQCVSVLP